MLHGKEVKVLGRAKKMLDNVPPSGDAARVAACILAELWGIQSGNVEPKVAPGESGIHTVELGESRAAKLCMRRPSQRVVEVHLIKLVKRR